MKASQGRIGLAVLAALVLLPFLACGGDHSTPPPSNTSTWYLMIGPAYVTMDQGATTQYSVTATDGASPNVVWTIQEGDIGGSITAQGLYTAPNQSGTFHVIATSTNDSSKKATAQVYVNVVQISVTPTSGELEPGESMEFTATVQGSVNHAVTWSVAEPTGGSITSSGSYTASTAKGDFHIVATSASNKQASQSAVVHVSDVVVVISPRAVGVSPGRSRQFVATVAGTMEDSVAWAVQEPSGGSISATGLYAAPSQAGEYHVLATSISHPGVTGNALVKVAPTDFVATGSMQDVRVNHTATLLQNGKVLVAGGIKLNGWESHATAELYDPATGTFQPTGSMGTGRDSHTATLLNNGKVLIAGGGMDMWASWISAEIYDPATGTFSPTSNMTIARANHTATKLLNGKVLIVGGIDWWSESLPQLSVSELYDPDTGTFTPTGTLPVWVYRHTATLLDDGRVLVVGGRSDFYTGTIPVSQIYDPATGTFSEAGYLTFSRANHTATLISGSRVLVAGGEFYTASEPAAITNIDDAEIFDPAKSQFLPEIEMMMARTAHTAVLMKNGQVLIAGGYNAPVDPPPEDYWIPDYSLWPFGDDSAELFDPLTSNFTIATSMLRPRTGHTATSLPDGRVLITGGTNDNSAELYAPSWTKQN